MITIDGSLGEGGGQILRSSLALSLVTGQPFQMTNIRAKRKKPGLMRQHLTAVHAAAKVGDAAVDGASIGSTNLIFKPVKVRAGHYTFAIGTSGSVTLVTQTILPALLTAPAESFITLEGGTHNSFAPPWDFLAKSFLPLINKMGPKVETELLSYGFNPAGGGKCTITISPAKINAIELLERGEIIHRSARAIVSNLSLKIARRELRVVAESLNWSKELLHAEEQKSNGPGNVLMIELSSEHCTEIITGFGEQGVASEAVAGQTVNDARRFLAAGVPVGKHLADQLMLPYALAGKGCYLTMPLSQHARTNLEVIRAFLDIKVRVEMAEGAKCLVEFG